MDVWTLGNQVRRDALRLSDRFMRMECYAVVLALSNFLAEVVS